MKHDPGCTWLLIDQNVRNGLGDKEALVEVGPMGRRTLTYAELLRVVENLAEEIRSIAQSDSPLPVAIVGSATLELVTAWLATMRAGHVAALLPPTMSEPELGSMVRSLGSRVIFRDSTVGISLGQELAPVETWLRAQGSPSVAARPADPGADGPGLVLFSSGSTGQAKACVHRRGALADFLEHVTVGAWGIEASDRVLGASGPHFSFGLQGIHVPLSVGATAILRPGTRSHVEFLDVLEQEQVTVFLAVPTLFHILWRKADRPSYRFNLRLSLSAGEHLPSIVRERWERFSGSRVLNSIGTTETFLPYLSERASEPGKGLSEIGSFEYRFEATAPVAGGNMVACHAVVRSRSMMLGYLPLEKHGGWNQLQAPGLFPTGDLFTLHEDRWVFAGRRSECIKVSGCWVVPSTLEEYLHGIPGVAHAAVTPVTTEVGLSRLRACVVLTSEAQSDRAAFLGQLQARMDRELRPRALKPERVEIVDLLPTTASGKVKKRDLPTYWVQSHGSV
ncbi:MAG: AMP-binding protein [Deltaproteobacteria bacterium]|nr:AMP-binding protein [Deltaproteobacteria bacterium]